MKDLLLKLGRALPSLRSEIRPILDKVAEYRLPTEMEAPRRPEGVTYSKGPFYLSYPELVTRPSEIDPKEARLSTGWSFSGHNNRTYIYKITFKEPVLLGLSGYRDREELQRVLRDDLGWSEGDIPEMTHFFSEKINAILRDRTGLGISQVGATDLYNPRQIASLKLVDHLANYDEDVAPFGSSELDADGPGYKWLSKFMSKPGVGNPNGKARKELEAFRPSGPVKVYRGMGWYEEELALLDLNVVEYPFELKETVKFPFKRPTSWTGNSSIAKKFAEGTGPCWVVMELTVRPEDVIVDTRLLSKDQLATLYRSRQREVILKKGTYSAKIVDIGYKNKRRLSVGWPGKDPKVWKRVADAFKAKASEFEEYKYGSPRQHYNGAPGITHKSKNRVYYVRSTSEGLVLNRDDWSRRGDIFERSKTIVSSSEVDEILRAIRDLKSWS